MDDGFKGWGGGMNKRRLFICWNIQKKKIGLRREYIINPTWHPPSLCCCCWVISSSSPVRVSCRRRRHSLPHPQRSSSSTASSSSCCIVMRLRAHRIVRLNGHGCFRILSSIQQLYTPPIGLYICKDVHVTRQPKIPGNPPSSVVPCRRIDSNFPLLLWMYNILFYFFNIYLFFLPGLDAKGFCRDGTTSLPPAE